MLRPGRVRLAPTGVALPFQSGGGLAPITAWRSADTFLAVVFDPFVANRRYDGGLKLKQGRPEMI